MDWVNIENKKPKKGQLVLIYCQGYGQPGNYWCYYELAYYDKNPYDKRKNAFIKTDGYRVNDHSPWLYRNVTHWQEMPKEPEKIKK